MKVLVFDDTAIHRQAAEILLADHEVTVVGTYDEAQEALTTHVDEEKRKTIMHDAGYTDDFNPWSDDISDDARHAYWEAKNRANEQATVYPDFDAVLTDLMVPASKQAQGDKGLYFVGQEMPLGSTIALLALFNGVKMVAVVTDTNHHDHPASAAFDCFHGVAENSGIRIVCSNQQLCQFDTVSNKKADRVDWNDEGAFAEYSRRRDAGELIGVKDWIGVLDELTGQSEDDDN